MTDVWIAMSESFERLLKSLKGFLLQKEPAVMLRERLQQRQQSVRFRVQALSALTDYLDLSIGADIALEFWINIR